MSLSRLLPLYKVVKVRLLLHQPSSMLIPMLSRR